MNVIASRRAEGYAKHFKTYGYIPTVITHTANELDSSFATFIKGIFRSLRKKSEPVRYESFTTHTEIRIPHKNTWLQAFTLFINKIPIFRLLFRIILIKLGHATPTLVYSYQNFYSFLFSHLKNNHYDYALCIYSPDYHIRLGYEINKKFGIPFIADYRDLWDNKLMDKGYIFPTIDKIILNHIIKNHRRWLANALFYTNVSDPWVEKMNSALNDNRGFTLTNGFDQDEFEENHTKVSKDIFYITYTGRIYPQNDFTVFLSAIAKFISSTKADLRDKIRIRFYTRKNTDLSKLKIKIPAQNLEVYNWVSKGEVINRLKESAILFLPGWPNIAGCYPGKAFEYLGTRRNILVAPDDGSVLNEMIERTKSGISSSDPTEVSNFLTNKFSEWIEQGYPNYDGIDVEIERFTRERLVERLTAKIDTFNKNNIIAVSKNC